MSKRIPRLEMDELAPSVQAWNSVVSPRPSTGMSTTDFTSARPASWKCVIAMAA